MTLTLSPKHFTRPLAFVLIIFTFSVAELQAQTCCCDSGIEVPQTEFDCFTTCAFNFGESGVDGPCAPAPVTMVSFAGNPEKGSNVLLRWETATESENSGFEVERADANLNWRNIRFVTGGGTRTEAAQYSFQDRTPFIGTNLYRLKQIDFDGTATYSEVITVDSEGAQAGVATVFPTVAQDELYIRYRSEPESSASAAIYNINGRLARTLKAATSVVNVSDLEAGHYVVVFTHEGKTYTERFLKNR